MVLCDTDVIIEYLKGNKKTKRELEKIKMENITLSIITLMEIYFGALNKKELNNIKRVLGNFNILKVNEDISDLAIDMVLKYSKSHGLRIPDSLIGATAVYYDIPLFTYNIKDFHFIKNINLYKQIL
jgi:predicted nucleic acid-binding protein